MIVKLAWILPGINKCYNMGIITNHTIKRTMHSLPFTSHVTMKVLNPGCLKFLISIWLFTLITAFRFAQYSPFIRGKTKNDIGRNLPEWICKPALHLDESKNISFLAYQAQHEWNCYWEKWKAENSLFLILDYQIGSISHPLP